MLNSKVMKDQMLNSGSVQKNMLNSRSLKKEGAELEVFGEHNSGMDDQSIETEESITDDTGMVALGNKDHQEGEDEESVNI